MSKKIKEVKEASADPAMEANNKRFNAEREQFLNDFRAANSKELIERLYKFLMVNDDITIGEDALYAFGAFHKSFFSGPQAPGTTGLEVYATQKFAEQHTKEYISNNISLLLAGTLKPSKGEDKKKAAPKSDYEAKE